MGNLAKMIELLEGELYTRNRNLETKREVQAAENAKEQDMLRVMESHLVIIKKEMTKEAADE